MPDKVEMETQKYMNAERTRALVLLAWLGGFLGEEDSMGLVVTEMRLIAPRPGKPDYMVVCKAVDGQGGRWVGFGFGATVQRALEDLRGKALAAKLNWRADQPYADRAG